MMTLLTLIWLACSPTKDATRRIQGTWQVTPAPEDLRRAEVLRLAFSAPPPTDEQIIRAKLSPEESSLVRSIRAAREDNASAPELQKMKAQMEGVASATLTITADEMRFALGGQTFSRSYIVLNSAGDSLKVRTTSPRGVVQEDVLTFRDDQTLEIVEPDGDTTTLRRLSANGGS